MAIINVISIDTFGVDLKPYLVITLFVISFFTACQFSSSTPTKPSHTKIYLSAQACDLNQSMAKKKALQALQEKSSLSSIEEFSSLERKQEDKLFCYEASVNEKEWGRYSHSLVQQRQRIEQESQEQNGTRFYSEKSVWIEELLKVRVAFNRELLAAKKVAPVESSTLESNTTRLTNMLNTKPSVKMDYRPCKHSSNYKCQLGFVSKVSDEDSRLNYVWNFGDGSTSKRKNPLHTYGVEGEYNVTLRVSDTHDAQSSVSTVLKVAKSNKPFARFKTDKRTYNTSETIIFTNNSYSEKSKIKAYNWNFGDGKTSTKRNPKHRYHKQGHYVVSLKVCCRNKQCSSASKKLNIKQGKALINAPQGTKIEVYMSEHGKPTQEIVKSKALMTAYKYGDIWLLCKRGKIECAVNEEGLVTNLLGQPKKCYWHEKHAKEYMVELGR